MKAQNQALIATEAACVTGVPLKQIQRMIDCGLLGDRVDIRKGTRTVSKSALVALKLAHATAKTLTLDARRQLVSHVLDDPASKVIRIGAVCVETRPAKSEVRRKLAALETAKKKVKTDKLIMSGDPCFKGTRIPVHIIAGMLESGESVDEVISAYPTLTEDQVVVAPIYAEAYPLRARPRRKRNWLGYRLESSRSSEYRERHSFAEAVDR